MFKRLRKEALQGSGKTEEVAVGKMNSTNGQNKGDVEELFSQGEVGRKLKRKCRGVVFEPSK